MRKAVILSAVISSALTLAAVWGFGGAALPSKVTLENAHVRISQVTYEPGLPREHYIRPTNQVIVFLDDCRYERTDPKTGAKTIQERKSGDVIWHTQGEDAPQLVNKGAKPYRTVVIELK